MTTKTPDQITQKWQRRLKGATVDIQNGVAAVSVAPGKKAAAKVDKMRAKLLEAIDSGVWAKQVSAVSLQDWQNAMTTKGVQRISQGVDGATDKMTEFNTWLVKTVTEGQAKVNAMPDLTLEDSIARMETFVRHMSSNKYKKT